MPRDDLDRIREKIRLCQYYMSAHAMEEMAEDGLTILDMEEAVLSVGLRGLKTMTLEAQEM